MKIIPKVNFGLIVIVVLVSSMLLSCMVHPQMTDIPLINKKKDLRVDAGISAPPAAFATISYGLTDKIAIQAFGSIGSDNRYYFQAAGGIYQKRQNHFLMEVYSGFGYGQGEAFILGMDERLRGNYQIYFGQINYGKVATERSNIEYGFGLKAGYLHSNLIDYNFWEKNETDLFQEYNDENIVLEPSSFVRFGGNRLKITLKCSANYIYKFTHKDKHLPYNMFSLGLGINYRL